MGETLYGILSRISDILRFFNVWENKVLQDISVVLQENDISDMNDLRNGLSKTHWIFKKYKNPEKVNWLGWIEVGNQAIAWIDLDRKILFKDEMKELAPDPMEAE